MQQTPIFSKEALAILDTKKIPRHVAIIPDGNRRWAYSQSKSAYKGHSMGATALIETMKAAKEIGIQNLTFYLFSTENWNRPKREVTALMWLLKKFLEDQSEEMLKYGVRLRTIGNISALSLDVVKIVENTIQKTAHCRDINMILALNYGSRDEICRAVQKIVDASFIEFNGKRDAPLKITETMIAENLDTAAFGDPELLIRTSGEMRVSNFLLWQLSYTELYVTPVYWPEFKPINLLEAVTDFQRRERRLGGK